MGAYQSGKDHRTGGACQRHGVAWQKNAFALGARTGVRPTRTPSAASTASNAGTNFASRSRSSTVGRTTAPPEGSPLPPHEFPAPAEQRFGTDGKAPRLAARKTPAQRGEEQSIARPCTSPAGAGRAPPAGARAARWSAPGLTYYEPTTD